MSEIPAIRVSVVSVWTDRLPALRLSLPQSGHSGSDLRGGGDQGSMVESLVEFLVVLMVECKEGMEWE